MSKIDEMLADGIMPDFEELYTTGKLIPVRQRRIVSCPITSETPGFTHIPEDQIEEILEIEGF